MRSRHAVTDATHREPREHHRSVMRRAVAMTAAALATAMVLALPAPSRSSGSVSTPAGAAAGPSGARWTWTRSATNPVIVPESLRKPGTLYPVMGDPTLLHDNGLFKMWFGYGGYDRVGDEHSIRVRTAYAESTDGLGWTVTAPVLDVGTTWDRTNAETPSVIKDDRLPEGHPRKYRMYYAGLDHAREKLPLQQVLKLGMLYGIGLAFSPDGKRFQRIAAGESPYRIEGLVLRPDPPADRDMSDLLAVTDPSVLVKDGRYHMWYTSMARVAREDRTYFGIAYATSEDGIRWTKHGLVMRPDLPWETARKEPSVGRPYVIWTGTRFEMFYDAMKEDDNPQKNTAAGIGFAWSADGRVWTKDPAPVFQSNHGANERKGIIVGSGVLLRGGAYYLYYPAADPDWNRWVFNLAIGRRMGP